MPTDPLVIVAAVIVGVMACARLTRLLVFDSYPPARWLRDRFQHWALQTRPVTEGKPGALQPLTRVTWRAEWATLVDCGFCAAPYIVAGSLTWALIGHLDPVWWIFHGWLAASYAASIVVARDEPPE